jgi:hypothetical protein
MTATELAQETAHAPGTLVFLGTYTGELCSSCMLPRPGNDELLLSDLHVLLRAERAFYSLADYSVLPHYPYGTPSGENHGLVVARFNHGKLLPIRTVKCLNPAFMK